MKTAIIYTRISTENQDSNRQIDELQTYAKANNINVLKVFSDVVSGKTRIEERQQFDGLINFIDNTNEKIDYFLTWEMSRIGRNLINVLTFVEELHKRMICVYLHSEKQYTLDEQGNKTQYAALIMPLMGSIYQQEVENIIQRTKSGKLKHMQDGGSGLGIKTYGYEKTADKKLIIQHEEAEIVREVFELYAYKKYSTQDIANYLNSKNISTRKKAKWLSGTVGKMLKNIIYVGKRKYVNQIYVQKHLQIIDEKTFDKVQDILKSKINAADNRDKHLNILKQKITCTCGKNYTYKVLVKNKQHNYCCQSIDSKFCGNASIEVDKFNNAIYFFLKNNVDFTWKKIEDKIKLLFEEIKKNDVELEKINADFIIEKRKEEKLLNLYLSDKLDEQLFLNKKAEIENFIKLSSERKLKLTTNNMRVNDEIKTLQNTKMSDIIENPESFKSYAKEIISSIKIEKIIKTNNVGAIYSQGNDRVLLVEINTIHNGYHSFIISQRSDKMTIPVTDTFYDEIYENTYVTATIPQILKTYGM
jgi:site-specific DNA recombinase